MTSIPEAPPPARPADLRMARLHLRLGSLELARAELEAFAGAGALDADALLDLAEIRWRTGDVSGAGVAAQAYLGDGGDDALALVIAAEAAAAAGRPTDARRLAAQVLERGDVPLEGLFAGIPRSGIWPIEPDERPEPAGELFEIPATRRSSLPADAASPVAGDDEPGSVAAPAAAATSSLWGEADEGAPGGAGAAASFAGAAIAGAAGVGMSGLAGLGAEALASPEPVAELEAARADLAAGRRAAAATRLAIALRLAPDLATDVLDALADVPGPIDPAGAGLELVRGDAYHQVGREADARRSYAAARAALDPGALPPVPRL